MGNAGYFALVGDFFYTERRYILPGEIGQTRARSLLQSRGQLRIAGFQRIYFIFIWFNSEAIDLLHGCFVLYCAYLNISSLIWFSVRTSGKGESSGPSPIREEILG